jgi:hypothetical protein
MWTQSLFDADFLDSATPLFAPAFTLNSDGKLAVSMQSVSKKKAKRARKLLAADSIENHPNFQTPAEEFEAMASDDLMPF